MPRRNLDDNDHGRSERITVRLGRKERDALAELAALWPGDRSDIVRRALREAVDAARSRRRAAIETDLPTRTLAELRVLATDYRVRGRSTMTKAELAAAVRSAVQARTAPLT